MGNLLPAPELLKKGAVTVPLYVKLVYLSSMGALLSTSQTF